MANYIQCEKCLNFSIPILGDRALGCEYCMNEEHDYPED